MYIYILNYQRKQNGNSMQILGGFLMSRMLSINGCVLSLITKAKKILMTSELLLNALHNPKQFLEMLNFYWKYGVHQGRNVKSKVSLKHFS